MSCLKERGIAQLQPLNSKRVPPSDKYYIISTPLYHFGLQVDCLLHVEKNEIAGEGLKKAEMELEIVKRLENAN